MGSETPNSTVTLICPDVVPFSESYFAEISTGLVAAIAVGAVVTVVIVIMFVESTWFIVQHYLERKTKILSIWMIGLQPVFAVTALIAVCIPRSALLSDLMAAIYMSRCLQLFLFLLIHYHGGEQSFIDHMSGETINLRSPPVACCCVCCPKIAVNEKNLLRIRMSVLQFAVLRPIFVLLAAVLWADDKYQNGKMRPNQASLYITVLNVVSALTAMYGMVLVFRASRKHLKEFNIVPKFICMQLVLVFSNLQGIVFNILASSNLPPCSQILPSTARGNVWNHLIIIVEMFLLALLARRFYRRIDGSLIIADVDVMSSGDKDKAQKNENSSLNNDTNILKYTNSGMELEESITYM
ncbi:organic solute transporter subunit alpha-like [Haliotis rufescens]|uniref:organic solute transporter subunit alpha-like n=1 Tax=Haliotis rufescens TaxID=6454 RepID=UPI00201F054A|nr:organic solute transporter subunit alpha-like [Haliotis rufescens]